MAWQPRGQPARISAESSLRSDDGLMECSQPRCVNNWAGFYRGMDCVLEYPGFVIVVTSYEHDSLGCCDVCDHHD
jgi:hypothetical protein